MATPSNFRAYKAYKWIVQDSQLLGGGLAVRGTRLPVSLILECLAGGWTVDEIAAEFEGWPLESLAEIFTVASELAEAAGLPKQGDVA